jgi:hypothetical protein
MRKLMVSLKGAIPRGLILLAILAGQQDLTAIKAEPLKPVVH